MANFLARAVPTLSIRFRILLIAGLSAVGLGAVAVTYWTGQAAEDATFATHRAYADLREAAHRFQARAGALHLTQRDFVIKQNPETAKRFEELHKQALAVLAEMQTMPRYDTIMSQADRLEALTRSIGNEFAAVVALQAKLGFGPKQGMQAALEARAAILVHAQRSTLNLAGSQEAAEISNSINAMRRFATEFRATHDEFFIDDFDEELHQLVKLVERTGIGTVNSQDAAGIDVKKSAQEYRATLGDLAELTKGIDAGMGRLDKLFGELEPAVAELRAAVATGEEAASRELEEARSRIQMLIVCAIASAVALCLGLSLMVGGGITRALARLSSAMERLAAGDTAIDIAGSDGQDEIGAMARTVLVFRDNAVERERLAAEQARDGEARMRRAQLVDGMVQQFERAIESVLDTLRATADQLAGASSTLTDASKTVSARAGSAGETAAAASDNVTAAATAAEELSASLTAVAGQAAQSNRVVENVTAQSQRTAATMSELATTAGRIGEVVGLIQAIAAQTNLLALNATIEAARAGEAGKGFAVVAAEVKSLANQTAKATGDIGLQVAQIQNASDHAGKAIVEVNALIGQMASVVAAVSSALEQQNEAVAAIAGSVAQASTRARSTADTMHEVGETADMALTTTGAVADLAVGLADQAAALQQEVRSFLERVRAA
jgi:methyl-accepting chemotaxis protein